MPLIPLLALFAGAIALGSSPILVRLSELEPTATALWRVAVAAPAFLFYSFARGEAPLLAAYSKAQWRGLFWLVAAGGCFAMDLFCLHWSLRWTSVVNATLFLNFAPIFVSLGAWAIFGELPTRRAVLSYAIAIGGIALLLGGVATFERGKLLGDGLGVAAGAAYGGYLLVVSRFRYKMPTSLVMGVTTLSCACFLFPVTLAMGESLLPRTPAGWATLLALALLTHAGGQGLLVFAIKYFPAFTSSVTLLLQPVVAACFAWILFNETLGPWQMLGGAIVVFGILLCHDAITRAADQVRGAQPAAAAPKRRAPRN